MAKKKNSTTLYQVKVDKDAVWDEIKFYEYKGRRDKRHWSLYFIDEAEAERFALIYGSDRNIVKTRRIALEEFNGLNEWLDANVGVLAVDWCFFGNGIYGVVGDPMGGWLDIAIRDANKAMQFKLVWG